MVFVFCFLKKSQLIIAYHYIIFLLRLRVTMILYEFVPTIKFESEMILSTYLHIFTDLKSKIQFGSVDLEFWVFNWYVLDLKVDLRNVTILNGGIFLIYWRLTSLIKRLLKTHHFKHDISQVCMELNDDAKVFMKSHLQIYVQTANLLLELKYVLCKNIQLWFRKTLVPLYIHQALEFFSRFTYVYLLLSFSTSFSTMFYVVHNILLQRKV